MGKGTHSSPMAVQVTREVDMMDRHAGGGRHTSSPEACRRSSTVSPSQPSPKARRRLARHTSATSCVVGEVDIDRSSGHVQSGPSCLEGRPAGHPKEEAQPTFFKSLERLYVSMVLSKAASEEESIAPATARRSYGSVPHTRAPAVRKREDYNVDVDQPVMGPNQEVMLLGHHDVATCLTTFGGKILSGSSDCMIRVWNTYSWRCEKVLDEHTGGVFALAVAGDRIVSAAWDSKVCVWNPFTWEVDCVLPTRGDTPSSLVALHTSVRGMVNVVGGFRSGKMRVWSICEGTPGAFESKGKMKGHSDVVTSVRQIHLLAAPRGAKRCREDVCSGHMLQYVVSTSLDKKVVVWRQSTWVQVGSITLDCAITASAVVTVPPGGQGQGHLVVGLADGRLQVLDLVAMKVVVTLQAHEGCVTGITAQARRVVSCGVEGSVKVWDSVNWKLDPYLLTAHQRMADVTMAGERLVSAGTDKSVRVWDLNQVPVGASS